MSAMTRSYWPFRSRIMDSATDASSVVVTGKQNQIKLRCYIYFFRDDLCQAYKN